MLVSRANGDGHPSAFGELILEGLGDGVGRAGDNDGVEGSGFGPTEMAVGLLEVDVMVIEVGEFSGGLFCELGHDFDGVDVGGNFGEDGGLVSRAGANFQDSGFRAETQEFGHAGDDERLGNGLAVIDGEGGVGVGAAEVFGSNELVPGDTGNGLENRGGGNEVGGGDERFQHSLVLGGEGVGGDGGGHETR